MYQKTVATKAKLNLALHVVGYDDDHGLHDLDTLIIFMPGICDYVGLTVSKHEASKPLSVGCSITDDDSSLSAKLNITGEFARQLAHVRPNILVKAARLFFYHFGIYKPIAITLEKNIPVSAGIGGGSGDAAAILYLLADAFDLCSRSHELLRLAAGVGYDVSLCLHEILLRQQALRVSTKTIKSVRLPSMAIVLVNDGQAIDTAQVFADLKCKHNQPLPRYHDALNNDLDGFINWLNLGRNDLILPASAINPDLGAIIDKLTKQRGCLYATMSGSGGTCLAIFRYLAEAQAACGFLKANNPDWWVVADQFN